MRTYNIRLAKRPLQAEVDITGLHHKEKGTLSFDKNGVRLDVCHWEKREVIWVGLAMGPVIANAVKQSRG